MRLVRITEGTSEKDFTLIYNNSMGDLERELAEIRKEIKAIREAGKRR